MSTLIIHKLNRRFRRLMKKIIYFLPDLYSYIFKNKNELIPPKWRNFSGDGDYKSIGNEFFEYFKDLGRIQPNSRILDVGSGIGRMAIPLTSYLNNGGIYEGFDIMDESVKWCKINVSTKFSNFHFQLANIYNEQYNVDGKTKACEYVFPYVDNYFDFVYLTSVFTHMLPLEVENYIAQISRVLKPGGCSLITFFLLNHESLELMGQGKSTIDFKFHFDSYRIKDNKIPEAAVAYDEIYIRNLFNKNNMKILEPVQYGSFCGREKHLSYQDIIISEKL